MNNDSVIFGGVNTDVPNVARIYDFFLGGTDNFAADRAAAAKISEAVPEVAQRVRENREFLGRAVRFLSGAGIRQFVDIGSGLPTRENVHQVARQLTPGARVAYIDNDPVVVVHAQALLPAPPDRSPRAALTWSGDCSTDSSWKSPASSQPRTGGQNPPGPRPRRPCTGRHSWAA